MTQPPRRWQKLTAYGMALAVIVYAIHESPASASAIVIGGVVPSLLAFVAGNVSSKKVAIAAESKP